MDSVKQRASRMPPVHQPHLASKQLASSTWSPQDTSESVESLQQPQQQGFSMEGICNDVVCGGKKGAETTVHSQTYPLGFYSRLYATSTCCNLLYCMSQLHSTRRWHACNKPQWSTRQQCFIYFVYWLIWAGAPLGSSSRSMAHVWHIYVVLKQHQFT